MTEIIATTHNGYKPGDMIAANTGRNYLTIGFCSRKILDIREEYYNEFRKFLSPKQIQKIYNMEKHNGDKFRKEMKKRQGMKKQHDGRRHMSQGDVKK